jgi:dolichyl-diphosphooligosaccharide---protein glycosyltransferase
LRRTPTGELGRYGLDDNRLRSVSHNFALCYAFNRFKLVYHSKYGKVRIFKILKVAKESKEWVKANKICDGDGWVCRGQYPPALQKILAQKKDFKQLEDFNVKGEDDSEYQKQYMENLM